MSFQSQVRYVPPPPPVPLKKKQTKQNKTKQKKKQMGQQYWRERRGGGKPLTQVFLEELVFHPSPQTPAQPKTTVLSQA